MVYCIAYCCNNKDKDLARGVRFYRLPLANKPLLRQWLSKLRLRDPSRSVSRNSRVCTEHFHPDCFERDLQAELLGTKPRVCLKAHAVPTIFSSISTRPDRSTGKRLEAFTDILQQPSSTAARIPDPHSDQKVKEDHETPSYASDDCLRTVRDASTQYDLSHIVHPEERAHCLTSSPIRDAGATEKIQTGPLVEMDTSVDNRPSANGLRDAAFHFQSTSDIRPSRGTASNITFDGVTAKRFPRRERLFSAARSQKAKRIDEIALKLARVSNGSSS